VLRKIERYEVLDELGHGGMATVYRARDSKLDRMIALKVMHPHLRGAQEARARFRREAQSVARLGHPRILEIYDYSGEDSEESYIASQLLTGPTLRVWADQHAPVPAEIAACIGVEIASALSAAHDKGIVHRDVKPENILLHENRELKLTDFGIADMVDSHSMTATGQILGSPGHMAPEQIEGDGTDVRTDVFALGTVLYFLSTGRLPFTGRNPHQILKRIVDGEYPDPLRIEPRLGSDMQAILKRCLEKKAADRYPTARALEETLRAFVGLIGIDDPGEEVARFLAAPDDVTKEVHAKVIERYTALGKEAQAQGKILIAHDRFSRVLALDDGNQEVLALLTRIGRPTGPDEGQRRRRAAYGAGVTIAALLGCAGVIAALGGDDSSITPDDRALATVARDGGTEPTDGGAEPIVEAGPLDAGVIDAGADAGYVVRVAGHGGESRRIPGIRPPRQVELVIDPANVSVAIDDGPPRSYVTLARGVELSIGEHRMSVHSNTSCCQDESFAFAVEPGEGALTVRRRLSSTPASLSVRGHPAALSVVIDGGRARGRGYGSLINIPIAANSRRERLAIEATAPGYLPFIGELDFAAGELTEQVITLERAPDEAPPPE
jgi:serine/threonine-protein kinase